MLGLTSCKLPPVYHQFIFEKCMLTVTVSCLHSALVGIRKEKNIHWYNALLFQLIWMRGDACVHQGTTYYLPD